MNEDEIIKLCVNVLANAELGKDVTIDGNDYSAFEAAGLARRVLDLIGLQPAIIISRTVARMGEIETGDMESVP